MNLSKQSFTPLGNKVLVLPEPKKEQTEGGIYIPETATKDEPLIGTVVEVGRGTVQVNEKGDSYVVIPLEVKVGDKVLYIPNDYMEIKKDDKTCILMTENEILAIV